MSYSVGIVMDPIASIKPYKDTSFAMMLEAQARGATLYYIEMQDLFIEQGVAKASTRTIEVTDVAEGDTSSFYAFTSQDKTLPLAELDVILMRKDPPVDAQFIYATHMLSLAQAAGTLVVNNPQSLRNFNEKLFTSYFPDLIPPTLVSANAAQIRQFHQQHGTIICKPLDGMGGASIFKVDEGGANLGVIIETLTQKGQQLMMAQRFMPAIKDGDKRILIVNGEVMPYALARLPTKGETRGNLAAGGVGRPQPLSDSDFAIANQIAPRLVEEGLMFVGLDVIGDKVTEINVTSPTCVREIERAFPTGIMAKLFDAIELQLTGTNA